MTDSSPGTEREPEGHPEPQDPMPKWVPVAIGVVLVTLAALAVITGLRYRDASLVNLINRRAPQKMRPASPAPPGEPEPGASLVFPGESGANVPEANAPVSQGSRAEVTGDASGVTAVVKMWARRGMKLSVTPDDTLVYVNDVAVGTVSQFDSDDEVYDFAAPGSYTVKLVAPGYKERQFIVTAAEAAKDEVATIAANLEKE